MNKVLNIQKSNKVPWFKRKAEKLRNQGKNRIILDRDSNEPYLERFYLVPRWATLGLMRVVIHRFWKSDDDSAWHDHPWGLWGSVILSGGYWEHTPDKNGKDVRKWRSVGDFCVKTGNSLHYVELDKSKHNEVWTLFFMFTPPIRKWGFVNFKTKEWTYWETFLENKKLMKKGQKFKEIA